MGGPCIPGGLRGQFREPSPTSIRLVGERGFDVFKPPSPRRAAWVATPRLCKVLGDICMAEEWDVWRYLARCYLDIQQLRMACEARLRRLPGGCPEEIKLIIERHYDALKREEKSLLKSIEHEIKNHPLWEWCKRVKGLGPVACLMFLGYINPYIASTAGKARAYFGVIPGAELKSGRKGNINPEAKGRLWLITRNVIMAKDEYYYPIYLKKREYYMENGRESFVDGKWIKWPPFKEILEDPTKCPLYDQCMRKLKSKAERLGRETKKPPCKLHLNRMSMRYLMSLLLSHATQLLREALGLDVNAFKQHRNYIPPKPP